MNKTTTQPVTDQAIRQLADEADFGAHFPGDRALTIHLCSAALNTHGFATREYSAECRARVAAILNAR